MSLELRQLPPKAPKAFTLRPTGYSLVGQSETLRVWGQWVTAAAAWICDGHFVCYHRPLVDCMSTDRYMAERYLLLPI